MVEEWAVPVLSAIALGEWLLILRIRSSHHGPRSDDCIALLDFLVVLMAAALLVSSFQYPGILSGAEGRIALGIVRVVLVVVGADILLGEYRDRRRRAATGGG